MAKDTETTVSPVEETVAVTNEGPMPQFSLNVGDIENAVKVIDFAAEQGAFKGWQTINDVMNIRNRLVVFLRQVQVPVTPDAETSAEVPESPGSEN